VYYLDYIVYIPAVSDYNIILCILSVTLQLINDYYTVATDYYTVHYYTLRIGTVIFL